MTSSYLTSDPDMQCVQILNTGHAMSKYQVSTMKETEVKLFSMIVGKLREDQMNTIHLLVYTVQIQVTSFFLS